MRVSVSPNSQHIDIPEPTPDLLDPMSSTRIIRPPPLSSFPKSIGHFLKKKKMK